jgi:phospholipid-translocating ATPase
MMWHSFSTQICYFFYKNIHFGFTLFYYEAYAAFSAQPVYNDWYMSVFNVFFTSLPVIALGVLEQDVSAQLKLQVRVIRI